MIAGIHVSTAGGIHNAPARLRKYGLLAGQIFTANQRRWRNPELSPQKISAFRESSDGLLIVSHSSYLINLASANPEVVSKSVAALTEELKRCASLGIRYLVMHPGAHQKAGVEKGIEMISTALREILPSVKGAPLLLLENTAGAGTTIGRSLQELASIRDASGVPELIGYCLDTAHACGSGFPIETSEGVSAFLDSVIHLLGSVNVKVFHINDSKVACGSFRDRHEHFGKGKIGLEPLRTIFRSPVFSGVPGIAETPGTDIERAEDIRMLVKT